MDYYVIYKEDGIEKQVCFNKDKAAAEKFAKAVNGKLGIGGTPEDLKRMFEMAKTWKRSKKLS